MLLIEWSIEHIERSWPNVFTCGKDGNWRLATFRHRVGSKWLRPGNRVKRHRSGNETSIMRSSCRHTFNVSDSIWICSCVVLVAIDSSLASTTDYRYRQKFSAYHTHPAHLFIHSAPSKESHQRSMQRWGEGVSSPHSLSCLDRLGKIIKGPGLLEQCEWMLPSRDLYY